MHCKWPLPLRFGHELGKSMSFSDILETRETVVTVFFTCVDLKVVIILITTRRVHNRFGGMRDLAFFRGDIRDLS